MTLSNTELTLLVPGLLGPQAVYATLQKDERGNFPSLQNFLSHAQVNSHAKNDWLPFLFELLALDVKPDTDLPLASICAAIDGVPDTSGWWLRVDPVYAQVDRDRAVLLAADELALKQQEADEIVAEFNTVFAEDGLVIFAPHPQRWYLRLDTDLYRDVKTTPLVMAMGQNINDFLPGGEARQYWHRLLNEMQMLLYNHAVNQRRESEGRITINSVWFWGAGALPNEPGIQWGHIYTDDPLVTMLARFCRTPCSSMSELDVEKVEGRILIVIPDCASQPVSADVFAWLQQLDDWERRLFAPLLSRMKKDKQIKTSLLLSDGRDFTLTAKDMRRWWRRNRSLDAFIRSESP